MPRDDERAPTDRIRRPGVEEASKAFRPTSRGSRRTASRRWRARPSPRRARWPARTSATRRGVARADPRRNCARCAGRASGRRGGGRGNRRRGLAEADRAGGLADALGTSPSGGRGDGGRARALGARPRRRRAACRGAFLPTTWWRLLLPRVFLAGPPTQNEIERFEAFSPNQPGFRAAVEALHREQGAGATRVWASATRLGARVRRRLDDVAATAWTSFLDRGMPIDRRSRRHASRARARSSWDPNHPQGPASTRPGAERKRVGALEDDALGRSAPRGLRGARPRRDPRASVPEGRRRDPRGGRPARRRRDADRAGGARGVRARRRALVAAAGSVARRWRGERRWRADDDGVDQKRLRDRRAEIEIADDSNADAGSSPTPRGPSPRRFTPLRRSSATRSFARRPGWSRRRTSTRRSAGGTSRGGGEGGGGGGRLFVLVLVFVFVVGGGRARGGGGAPSPDARRRPARSRRARVGAGAGGGGRGEGGGCGA